MRRWPWITLAAITIFVITPFGRDFIYLAFFSGEQLSRNIAQPIFFMALAVAAVLAMLGMVDQADHLQAASGELSG